MENIETVVAKKPTKSAFIAEYEKELKERYPWTTNEVKLKRFLDGVKQTMHGGISIWHVGGPAVMAAWHTVGGAGKVSLQALLDLPE